MNRKAAGILKYLLSLVLAGALIYFALRGIDWRAFAEGLGETRWGYALLYLLAALLALVFREERWRAMMLPLNPEVRRIDAWDSANVGNVVNVVLPGAGEFVRPSACCSWPLSRSTGTLSAASSSTTSGSRWAHA